MPKIIKKTVFAKWICDWCEKLVIRHDESVPEGWEDNNSGDHAGVFCCTGCYSESKVAWEESFEDSRESWSNSYESIKLARRRASERLPGDGARYLTPMAEI